MKRPHHHHHRQKKKKSHPAARTEAEVFFYLNLTIKRYFKVFSYHNTLEAERFQ